MDASSLLWQWLVHAALIGLGLSALGTLAVLLCRQPAKKLRLIELTLLACVVAPCLGRLPGWPQWSLLAAGERSALPDAAASRPVLPDEPGQRSLHDVAAASLNIDARDRAAVELRRSRSAAAPAANGTPSGSPSPPLPSTIPVWITRVRTLIPPIAAGGYLTVLILLIVRAAVGLFRLKRLHSSAADVPGWIEDQFAQLAGPRCRQVRLRSSNRIEVPITYLWGGPVILLPQRLCTPDERQALRFCLAHEWSHVERGDVRAWYLAAVVQAVCFYQPLVWWLRRQMRLSQDQLADARAAAAGPETDAAADYADFLVQLARRAVVSPAAPALGMIDRRSLLYRRIAMLLDNRHGLQPRCRRVWTSSAVLLAIAAATGFSVMRLDAEEKGEPAATQSAPAAAGQPPVAPAAAQPDDGVRSFTYACRVTDKLTGQGISGATVKVRRTLLGDPRHSGETLIEESVHTTAGDGTYAVTIPAEQARERYLYIELDVEHPEYAAKTGFGYAFSMIVKNQKLGEDPFFKHTELYPGKAVTGTVTLPDGSPVAGVKVLSYSKPASTERLFIGSFARTETDADGRFRLVIATPGEGVFWIFPKDHVPTAHIVPKDRGDIGRVSLEEGARLTGRVLDAKGEPVPSVWVNARREGDGNEDVDQFLGQNAVANHIGRGALSDAEGRFQLAALPPGDYRVAIEDHCGDPALRDERRFPVEPVFMPLKATLRAGETSPPLDIRAVPHVEIHALHVDSQGKPCRGHELHLFGRMDDVFYFTQSGRPADGRLVIKAPHGLERAELTLTTNEHHVLRYRLAKDAPLQNGRRIDLGTLNDDVRGLEIVRYKAPILLVKAVDESGQPVKEFKPGGTYGEGKSPREPGEWFINGVGGDVYFEQQQDGRWRSNQLLPDHEITVTALREGFKTDPQKVSLPEGEEKEIVFVLQKE